MKYLLMFAILTIGIGLVGCDEKVAQKADKKETAKKVDKHDQWWCEEHGIPEHDCLTCKHGPAGCKKKKDWCEEHEVAKSQCFKCNPELKKFYADQYRAKYGKEPPESTEN
jgi:hypothetical protein